MNANDLLGELQLSFPARATTGTFEPRRVAGGEYSALLDGLGVPTSVRLESAQGWQVDGEAVVLDGTATTQVLGLERAPVLIRFAPGGRDYGLMIDLTLPPNWRFGQSFEMLAAGVFEDLALDPKQQSALVIASADRTDDPRRQAAVDRGLTFRGFFDSNSDVFTQMAALVSGGAPGVVTGPIAYNAQTGIVEMALSFARGGRPDLFGSTGIELELDLYSGLDTAIGHYVMGVRFSATLDFPKEDGTPQDLSLEALLVDGSQGVLELTLTGKALEFPSPAAIERMFGAGNGIKDALPGDLSDTSVLRVNDLTVGIGLRTETLEFASLTIGALTGNPWKIWPGVIEVEDFALTFSIFKPLDSGARTFAFTFSAIVELGGVPIFLQGQLPALILSGRLPAGVPAPSLVPLVQHVFGLTNGLPKELVIADLEFLANVKQGVYGAEIDIHGDWEFEFGDGNVIAFEDLKLGFLYSDGSPGGEIEARFAVGENDFDVRLDMSKQNTLFHGSWKATDTPLDYQDIAIALNLYGLPDVPEGLDLALTEATFQFESAGPSFFFTLTTEKNSGVLVAGKDATGNWGFILGLLIGSALKVDLTDVDVIGKLVPAGDDVIALNDLRIVGASRALPVYTPDDAVRNTIGDQVSSGLAMSIALVIGKDVNEEFTVRFGGADDGSRNDAPPAGTSPPPAPPAQAAPSQSLTPPPATSLPGPQATYVNVQRAFGPVQLKRIGFAMGDGSTLELIVDGGVSLAGLSIALIGLEADIPRQSPFTPTFRLAGLGVQYSGAGLEIVGGLAHKRDTTEYTGILTIAFGNFGATAFGSYATTASGQPSLFAYLFVDYPLGGPPFFFVTGAAGGFGYNRSLKLPAITELTTYPLVQAAMGQLDQAQTLIKLDEDIGIEQGEYWLAAGVRFTSFELLKSFALVTVSFGAHVEIGLLGESTLSVPTAPPGETVTPVAQADLAVLVDIDITKGQLAVAAQLTPESYVFERSAQLTGGFAFYLWFPPNDHTGDFVVTLGGYNPYWTPPDHYPKQVPRLGLNWKVSDQLTVKGGLYFALTPAVMMAGGSLDANWTSGDIRAWFDAQADFLIRFKPFHYRIDVHLAIGASFTLNLWFTSKAITIQASANLHIEGPPFGGSADVRVSIISFSISFGDKPSGDPQPIGWSEFRKSFLPPANEAERKATPGAPAAPRAATPTPTDSLLTLTAPTGLTGTIGTGTDAPWIVHGTALTVAVGAQIPATDASVVTTDAVAPDGDWNRSVGVGPMGAEPGQLASKLTLKIERNGAPDDGDWNASAAVSNVPAGMWHNTTNSLGAPRTVDKAMTGLTLEPAVKEPDTPPRTVPVRTLLSGDPVGGGYDWSDASAPIADPFGQAPADDVLAADLVESGPARTGILNALLSQGLQTAETVDVAHFAEHSRNLLTSPPLLRYLGEVRRPQKVDS